MYYKINVTPIPDILVPSAKDVILLSDIVISPLAVPLVTANVIGCFTYTLSASTTVLCLKVKSPKETNKIFPSLKARKPVLSTSISNSTRFATRNRIANLFSFTSGPNGTAIIFSNRLAIQYSSGKIKNNIIEATLPVPYVDTNYSVVFSFDTDSLNDPDEYTSTNVLTKNTSSFKFGTYKNNTTGFSWITFGYVK